MEVISVCGWREIGGGETDRKTSILKARKGRQMKKGKGGEHTSPPSPPPKINPHLHTHPSPKPSSSLIWSKTRAAARTLPKTDTDAELEPEPAQCPRRRSSTHNGSSSLSAAAPPLTPTPEMNLPTHPATLRDGIPRHRSRHMRRRGRWEGLGGEVGGGVVVEGAGAVVRGWGRGDDGGCRGVMRRGGGRSSRG